MKKFIYVLMTIIQYIAFGAAIYLWRFQHQKVYIVAGAFTLMFFAFWGRISVKEDVLVINMEDALFALSGLLFPSIWDRLILIAILALKIYSIGMPSMNKSPTKNKYSYSNLSIGTFWGILIVNVWFCHKFWHTGSKIWNLIYTIVLSVVYLANYQDAGQINLYDEWELQQERERKEQKQREKDRKRRYIDSSFARALSIPYSKVMNDRGMYGEYCTSTYYTDIDACDYKVLYSVYIPTDDDIGSTEIDSLIITPYGLFVNEIKNRKLGWSIYGDYQEADAKHRDGSVSTEKSPVYQNKNHMKALRIYMERHLHNELAILNNRILGCVALGPETLFSDTEIVYPPTNQTVCSFRKIGIKINGVLERSKQAGCTNYEARYMAMERVYKELLKYQNNRSLKKRHDRVVKQMGWQSNVTYA